VKDVTARSNTNSAALCNVFTALQK